MLIRLLFLMLFAFAGLVRAEEPLPPEQAFHFSARAIDAKTIEARWQITDQYYMYRDKFKFSADGGILGTPKYPPGKVKDDENFGKVETYRKEVKILIPVEAAGALSLKAVSQGCWDGGICYPPINQEARIELPSAGAASSVVQIAAAPAPTLAPDEKAPAAGDESSRIAGLFKGDNLALVLVSFFGFGLLLSFTPCVFPMIPILSGIIVNHGHAVSHLRAFRALAGLCARHGNYLRAGRRRRRALRHAAVGGLQNVVGARRLRPGLRVLSLSMFGFYELQLPPHRCKAGFRTPPTKQGRFAAGHRPDGRALGADRRPLRGRAAGRCPALHRADRQRRAGWRRLVRHGAGHGRAALAGRRLLAQRCCPSPARGWRASRRPSA
jgi:thiol:disulfide interchange protein DsbD